MNAKYKVLARNTAIFALGSVGSKLILFLLVPLYTNYMSADEYGIADLVFTIGEILVPFFSGGIFNAVIRFGISKNHKGENVLRNSYLVATLGSILLIILTPVLGCFHSISGWKWFLSLYVISDIYSLIGLNYLKSKERNKSYAIICLVRAAVLGFANIILLVVLKKGIEGYLSSTIISCIVTFALAVIAGDILSDLKQSQNDKKLLTEMLSYSAPLILNGVSWWVIHSSDKIMIELIVGSVALGIYSVAGKIPSVINIIVSIFTQAWDISSIKEIEDNSETTFFAKVFTLYSFTTFLVTMMAIAITKPFMSIYVGKDFRECWVYVPLLLVSASYGAIGSYFGSFYAALKKSRLSMYSTLFSAVLNIIINFSLIPFLGIWGAVIGTLVSYIAVSVYRMVTVLKLINIPINILGFIMNYFLVLVCAIIVSLDFHVYLSPLIVLILFFVLNKNNVVEILNKIMVSLKTLSN